MPLVTLANGACVHKLVCEGNVADSFLCFAEAHVVDSTVAGGEGDMRARIAVPLASKGIHTCVSVCDPGCVRESVVYTLVSCCMVLGAALTGVRYVAEESLFELVVGPVSDFTVVSGVMCADPFGNSVDDSSRG